MKRTIAFLFFTCAPAAHTQPLDHVSLDGVKLVFTPNVGQADSRVLLLSSGDADRVFLTQTGVTLATGTGSVAMEFLGGSRAAHCYGIEALSSKSNFLIGSNPNAWHLNVTNFQKARCDQVYPGVDLLYYGNRGHLEYDMILHPHANPAAIHIRIEGVGDVYLDHPGDLVVQTGGGSIRFERPTVYQESAAGRRLVRSQYVLGRNHQVRFRLGPYQHDRPLVIDPVVTYSTVLGGHVALDPSGNIYLTGSTLGNLPVTPGVVQPSIQAGSCFLTPHATQPCTDAFVAKLDPTGTNVIYATYLGGSGDDAGAAIAVDASGCAYVTGSSSSLDFPVVNPLSVSKPRGLPMGFVARLDPNGATLVYSTLLGGTALATPDIGGGFPYTSPTGIAVDGSGNAYVTGFTDVTDFPVMHPLQAALNGTTMFASFDNGATWTAARGLQGSSADAIVVDPNSSSIVYAGGTRGIFKSTDSGRNWTQLNTGFTSDVQVGALAVDPTQSATLYAAIRPQGADGVVLKSMDGGLTWSRITNGLPDSSALYVVALLVDPTNPATLYANTRAGVFKSTDGGGTWRATGLVEGLGWPPSWTFGEAAFLDPNSPSTIYAGVEAGILKSDDGGQTWTPVNPVDALDPWSGYLAIDPVNSSVIYATTHFGKLYKSADRGVTWSLSSMNLPATNSPNTRKVAIDPLAHDSLYLTTSFEGAFLSTDGAATWREIPLPEPLVSFIAARGGNVYVGLEGYPTSDAFVTKLSPSGALLFSTYLGGDGTDEAHGIALDKVGNIYITGRTDSPDLPIASAIQPNNAGKEDAFVSVLKADGSALIYSTYLGGTDFDRAAGIAVDASGSAYIVGTSISSDFPTVNAMQPHYAGGDTPAVIGAASDSLERGDAFITKLSPDGKSLVFSTYFGGTKGEEALGIGLDALGAVYIEGVTLSPDLPLVNPVRSSFGATTEAGFAAKLNPAGSALEYSTFLDPVSSIAVTPGGTAYVSGASVAIIHSDAAVVSAASFLPGMVSPGEAITLFGENLASGIQGATLPLPSQLLDVTITVAGTAAPLYYVSPTQINLQVPLTVASGPAELVVKRGNAIIEDQTVQVADATPRIFVLDSSGTAAVTHGADFRLVTAGAPAAAGEVLSIFCVGLGAVSPAIPAGSVTPIPPPVPVNMPQVTARGEAATVLWAGLVPGYSGLYQINVQLPADLPAGSVALQVIAAKNPSNTVNIPVQ